MSRPITKPSRGIGTLIGNGWLREAPKNMFPRAWDVRGRSALRKCLFLPAPDAAFREQLGPYAVLAMPPAPRRPEPPIEPPRRDPKKWAGAFPAYEGAPRPAPRPAAPLASAWYEDPIALGTLLLVAPPIGLAALWSSKRYTTDARWALTLMTGLSMCLCAAVAVILFFAH
jgi:hypothetical protein